MYKIGDIFYIGSLCRNYYILAMFEYSKVSLINLSTGNRWDTPVEVNDPFAITEDEFIRISSNNEFSVRKVNLKFVEIEVI